jgi:DNA polymerase bacteriophage-type
MRLYIDFETHSTAQIRRGLDVYFANAKPLLCTYAIDDGPVQVVDFTEGERLSIPTASEIWAHNANFDRQVMSKLLGISAPISHWRCSQANALLHSLPGGLDPLCEALGVPSDLAKIKDGKRLIQKFCCRKEFAKDHEWPLFIQYAVNDIKAMRECIKRMPNWNYKDNELTLWQHDQTINSRGVCVDSRLASNAVAALAKEKIRLGKLTSDSTAGAVESTTQREKFLTYICEKQGVYLPDLKAATINEALEDDTLDQPTRELLKLRLEASKTSGAKYKRVLECVGSDDRMRGTLQFAGASRTARWAGRYFQPQNLPRHTMHADDIKNCIDLFRDDKADLVPLFAGINEAASNAIRGLIVAEPGKTLFVADYSSIEGRVNAWLAGEPWKIKAFREGQDLYNIIYANAFGLKVEGVSKAQRQIGKVMELGLGFGGGVGAFLGFAAMYNLDLEELGRTVPPAARAIEAWETALAKGNTYGLDRNVFIACDTLKIGYRKGNPCIAQSWYQYEDAVRKVIDSGKAEYKVQVGRLVFDCNGSWLRIKLPSGRFLCYASPAISSRGDITYFGWHNKRWIRTKTYGGKLCENIVQAISRDLLGAAIVRVEAAGYPVVLHVHDEIISEVSPDESFERFIELMATNPAWAAGLPLEAKGFQGGRYEK